MWVTLLDSVITAALSPRNDFVKNYRVHPTHWLIYTQVATPAADDAGLKCVDSEKRPPPDSHYVVPAKGLRPPPSRIARRPLEPVDQPPPPPATAKEEDASLVSSLPEEYRYASDEMSSSSSSEDSDEYDDDGYRRLSLIHISEPTRPY